MEQQGSGRVDAAVGWRGSKEAAGERGCRGEGVPWCVQCAHWPVMMVETWTSALRVRVRARVRVRVKTFF